MTEELKRRIILAVIIALVVASIILFTNSIAVFGLALTLGLLAWREYARLTQIKKHLSFYIWGYAWVLLSFTFSYILGPQSMFWIFLAPLSAFSLLAINRWLHLNKIGNFPEQSPEEAWKLVRDFTFGALYIFMLVGFVGPIARKLLGQELLLMSITAVALADTAAYFGGKKWGKKKLWPSLSPGKTLEGAYSSFVGSFAGALIVCVLFKFIAASTISWGSAFAVGLLAAPLAIQGDLLESLMKRIAGAKDSGTLIPGHGGLLDRIDAFVFVFPVIYFLF